MNKPRRWFRFSLGALLLLVTVFGGWLAWQVNAIHRRQAALARIKPHTTAIITFAAEAAKPPAERFYMAYHEPREIPIWRRLMGDQAVAYILFAADAPDEEFLLATKIFPEAQVGYMQ